MKYLFIFLLILTQLDAQDFELVSPNGGEIYSAGEIFNISWDGGQELDSVRIEFSSNAGENWELVAETNGTQYSWTAPEINSDQCLIRVSQINVGGPLAGTKFFGNVHMVVPFLICLMVWI